MRILLVVRNIPPEFGGGGRQALCLAKELARLGHQLTIVTDTANPDKVSGCVLEYPHRSKSSWKYRSLPARRIYEYFYLSSLIRTDKFDFVYCKSATSFTLSAIAIANLRRIPNVVVSSLVGSDDVRSVRRQTLGYIYRRIYVKAGRLICPSPALSSIAVDEGVSPERVSVIPNMIDRERFDSKRVRETKEQIRDSLGLESNCFVFLTVGAVCKRKGTDRALEGIVDILQENNKALFVVLGPLNRTADDRAFASRLLSVVKERNIADQLLMKGQVDDVPAWMLASDLFIFGSKREGLGNVFIESMYMHLPIVAYNIPDITDYVFGALNEFCIAESKEDFKAKVNAMYRSKEHRKNISDMGRQHCLEHYSVDRVVASYLNQFALATNGNAP